MPSRPLLLATVAALAAVAPASASAATVAPTKACFLNDGSSTKAGIAATGFTPGSTLSVTVDGKPVVTASADAAGGASGTIPVPGLGAGTAEAEHQVTISDGTNSASASFSTTRIRGDFSPASGNPATLKVSHSVFGMNLVEPSTVYLHYVTPGGSLKKTVKLGRAQGACGHITSTKRRKLFNFRAQRGKWTLQYDTSKKYRKGNGKTPYPWATVRVKITRIFL